MGNRVKRWDSSNRSHLQNASLLVLLQTRNPERSACPHARRRSVFCSKLQRGVPKNCLAHGWRCGQPIWLSCFRRDGLSRTSSPRYESFSRGYKCCQPSHAAHSYNSALPPFSAVSLCQKAGTLQQKSVWDCTRRSGKALPLGGNSFTRLETPRFWSSGKHSLRSSNKLMPSSTPR